MNSILEKIINKIKLDEKTNFDSFNQDNIKYTRTAKPLQLIAKNDFFLIAECKKASPSKGLLVKNYSALALAKEYQQNGASAISVLTEKNYFLGTIEDFISVKNNTSIPVLRKDFIIHPYQVFQSFEIGADIVLLIVACLNDELLKNLYAQVISLGMTPLIEVHTKEELEKALELSPELIGINNRNLSTFEIDIETSFKLKNIIPNNIKVISESGIKDRNTVARLKKEGFFGALVGESLLTSQNASLKIKELIQNTES
jgi:indole-3-glycerol phosphate synthase